MPLIKDIFEAARAPQLWLDPLRPRPAADVANEQRGSTSDNSRHAND